MLEIKCNIHNKTTNIDIHLDLPRCETTNVDLGEHVAKCKTIETTNIALGFSYVKPTHGD
jgi:hypothetical protein